MAQGRIRLPFFREFIPAFQAIQRILNDDHVGFFYDRGDPSAFDFTETDLTTDGTPYDLDLSSIIPSRSKAVLIEVSIRDGAVGSYIQFRKKGNSNWQNRGRIRTQAANARIDAQMKIFCDSDSVVEYQASNLTFTDIDIVVIGWWK